jgi:hypothetical protein
MDYIETEEILRDVKARAGLKKFSKQLERNSIEFSVGGFYIINYGVLASVGSIYFYPFLL